MPSNVDAPLDFVMRPVARVIRELPPSLATYGVPPQLRATMVSAYYRAEYGLVRNKKAVWSAPWWKSLGGKSRAGNILNGFRLLPHRQLDLNGKQSGKSGKPFAIRRTVDY